MSELVGQFQEVVGYGQAGWVIDSIGADQSRLTCIDKNGLNVASQFDSGIKDLLLTDVLRLRPFFSLWRCAYCGDGYSHDIRFNALSG